MYYEEDYSNLKEYIKNYEMPKVMKDDLISNIQQWEVSSQIRNDKLNQYAEEANDE